MATDRGLSGSHGDKARRWGVLGTKTPSPKPERAVRQKIAVPSPIWLLNAIMALPDAKSIATRRQRSKNALKSLTLVPVGPGTKRSPSVSKAE